MTTNGTTSDLSTRYLTRADGRVAYEIGGEGPLVVLVPGMGDLRSTYRFLAPVLRDAGYRVAVTDLRGHGDSDSGFGSYGDVETAGDVTALIEELGGPAVVVGNSMGAGAGVLVAAERPDLVDGLALVGPFVRNGPISAIQRLGLRLAMARPWTALSWRMYLPKLYAGRKPADFEEYRARVVAALHRPGYARSFSLTSRTSHDPAEARLADVSVPSLVVMGREDPDFADPEAEARWISGVLGSEVVMVAEAGHYPQSQQPEVTGKAVVRFLGKVTVLAKETEGA
jgi:pimeloyl-ACP methyl ester carboxylesterase